MTLHELKEKVGARMIISYLVLMSCCFLSFVFHGVTELQAMIILFSFSSIAPIAIAMLSFILVEKEDAIITIPKQKLTKIGKELIRRNYANLSYSKSSVCSPNAFFQIIQDYYARIEDYTVFDPNEELSLRQVSLVHFITIGHPVIALVILLLKSFSLVLLDDPTLLTLCTFGSLIFGVFWSIIFSKFFKVTL